MLSAVAPMALVLGLLGGLLWWLRRMARAKQSSGRHLRVIETVELAPGRSLHLIEVGGRGLVVASSAQRCELVAELDSLPREDA